MPNAVWPVTLPQIVQIRSYHETPPELSIITPVEVGPPKSRRRGTKGARPVDIQFSFTTEQVNILDDFYCNTLAFGSKVFDWKHPRTFTDCTYLFAKRPEYSLSGDHRDWTVQLPLLIVLP